MKTATRTGKSEYVEKRSRFIGLVVPVESEEQAREVIASVKKEYHDARHNCWCYIIDGKAERYSDDGEPQGTAGIPMLEVFRKNGVSGFVCVVTRYFGGVLLGSGGLLRAYTKAARDAMEDSAPEEIIEMQKIVFDCAYSDIETYKNVIASYDGRITDTEYGENVRITAEMPDTSEFSEKYLWKKK